MTAAAAKRFPCLHGSIRGSIPVHREYACLHLRQDQVPSYNGTAFIKLQAYRYTEGGQRPEASQLLAQVGPTCMSCTPPLTAHGRCIRPSAPSHNCRYYHPPCPTLPLHPLVTQSTYGTARGSPTGAPAVLRRSTPMRWSHHAPCSTWNATKRKQQTPDRIWRPSSFTGCLSPTAGALWLGTRQYAHRWRLHAVADRSPDISHRTSLAASFRCPVAPTGHESGRETRLPPPPRTRPRGIIGTLRPV